MRISDDEFDAAVAEALDGVPERFKAVLHNIAITVADEPTDRERGTMADPRGELLGLYQGVPLPQRTTGYSGVLPDIITIFKGRLSGSAVRGRSWWGRSAKPCCTRSATTSASTTTICMRTGTDRRHGRHHGCTCASKES